MGAARFWATHLSPRQSTWARRSPPQTGGASVGDWPSQPPLAPLFPKGALPPPTSHPWCFWQRASMVDFQHKYQGKLPTGGVRWYVWCRAPPSHAPTSSCSYNLVAIPLPSCALWSTPLPSGVFRGAPGHERSWNCAPRFLPGGRQWGTLNISFTIAYTWSNSQHPI